jgi:hypothetical protein
MNVEKSATRDNDAILIEKFVGGVASLYPQSFFYHTMIDLGLRLQKLIQVL